MTLTKIDHTLRTRMNTVANQEQIRVIVRHKRSVFSAEAALSRSPTIEQKFRLFPAEAVEVTPGEIDELSQQEDVAHIWPDMPVEACLNSSAPAINVPQVWNEAGLKGDGIRIAIVDTGLDDSHPDFAGRVMAAESFVGGNTDDENGHGTHVAGVISGSGSQSGGNYTGVAPAAHLYIAKALRADGSGSMSSVMAGIEWAVLEQQAQIINLSLGGRGPCDGTDALSVLCDEAVRQAGVVICVAAGNWGPEASTIGPPGCARYVITVGAMTDAGEIAAFSSRGPTADGRIKPDIVFPGVEIIAPQAEGTQLGAIVAEGYVVAEGTSMAAPHASGVAALMLEANPELTAEQVKTLMMAGAVDIDAPPNAQGVGRGDAYRAYQNARDADIPDEPPPPPPPPPPPSQPEPDGCLTRLLGG